MLYRLLLPVVPNTGGEYPKGTRARFLGEVADAAGGYTLWADTEGFWRDPESGKDYIEIMSPLEVSCEPHVLPHLVTSFKRHFPDQLSLMVVNFGIAEFINLKVPE